MYKNFTDYIWGMLGMSGSWERLVYDMTEKLNNLRKRPNYSEVLEINPTKLVPGRFYLIQYDFNGNYIWCPILALDYKVHKNSHILYAINLEYLAPRYKMLIFNKIFKDVHVDLDLIAQKELVRDERAMDFINFENMYKVLKANGNMQYAITGYSIKNSLGNFKIRKSYLCSVKIAPEIIFSDFKRYNAADMMKLHQSLVGEEQVKMGEILTQYNTLIEEYQADSIAYHKKVALFREKLKLFNE